MVNVLSGDIVVAGKDHDIVKDTRLHTQSIRNLNVIIEVLNSNDSIVDTIHGIVLSGSTNINGSSLIRRTGSIEVMMVDKVIPRSGNLFWLNNKIRVYVGIRDNQTEEDYTHYCIGTYYISSANTSVDNSGKVVSIDLEDYMMKWDNTQLEEQMIIKADVPLNIAVIETMKQFGENNLKVEITEVNVPYDLEFNVGDTVLSIVEKLRDLYMDYDCYYTADGTFVFRQMKIQLEGQESIKWTFDGSKDISTSINKVYDFKGVKNKVVVFGKTLKNGTTPTGSYSIADKENQFHEGNVGVRSTVITDSTYYTNQQCESRALYELYKNSNMKEKFTINTVPIYFLDAQDLIEVYNEERENFEPIKIDSISFNLSIDSEMTITGNKLHYNTFDFESIDIETYKAIADTVLLKIRNKGWLTLAQSRIKEYYGLKAKGNAEATIRFCYSGKGGVTAFVTAYEDNRNQSLTIDLADFYHNVGDSGNNYLGKGDYADRVLGHETLHLVMNDDFTASKTQTIPEWYKEGMGELLHGADERLKNVIVDQNIFNNEKAQKVIDRGVELLSGATLQATTEDYASSYILCKLIAVRLKELNKTFVEFHDTMRKFNGEGSQAFRMAMMNHVGTVGQFAEYVAQNGFSHLSTVIDLQLNGDEVDTGSIAGINHFGGAPLNAEDVFDNSQAEQGVYLNDFYIIIEKP